MQTPAQQGEKGENIYVSWEQSMSLAPIASIDSTERAIVQHTCGRRAIQYTIKTNEKKKIILHPEVKFFGGLGAHFYIHTTSRKIRFSKNKTHILVIRFQVTTGKTEH